MYTSDDDRIAHLERQMEERKYELAGLAIVNITLIELLLKRDVWGNQLPLTNAQIQALQGLEAELADYYNVPELIKTFGEGA